MHKHGETCWNAALRLAGLLWLTTACVFSLLARPTTGDFCQYYMGATIARHGAWASLYPIPMPTSPYNASWAEASTMRPEYERLAKQAGVPTDLRFFQAPSVALLLTPLALLDFRTAHWVWAGLMILCVWGVALQAGQMYHWCAGRGGRTGAVLTLVICLSPMAIRTVRSGNVTALVALCLGHAVLGMRASDSWRVGVGLLIGGLAKYATLVLLPLLAVLRRWRTLIGLAVLGSALLAVSVWIMGVEPFSTWWREIVPTLNRSHEQSGNQSLRGLLLRLGDRSALPPAAERAVSAAGWLTLAGLLALLAVVSRSLPRAPRMIAAAAAAFISWMLIFGPLAWTHYCFYLYPLWGWLLWEARLSRGRGAVALTAMLLSWHSFGGLPYVRIPEPFNSHMLAAHILILGLAAATLLHGQKHPPAK